MNQFKNFNIEITTKGFEGNKIKMTKVLNQEIIIHHYKIEDSKVFKEKGTGKCLQLQIEFNGQKHIIFTGAAGLIEMIEKVPENGFPFTTTIIEENERYKFS